MKKQAKNKPSQKKNVAVRTKVKAGGYYYLIYDRPTPDAQVVGASPA